MNYKTTTFIFGALLVLAFGFIVYVLNKVDSDDVWGKEYEVDEEEIRQSPRVPRSTGGFIPVHEAKNKLLKLKTDHRRRNVKIKNLWIPYGFSFGLDSVNTLIARIDSLNSNELANSTDKITGIRLYLSVSTGDFGGKQIDYLDLFMTPVRESGVDYDLVDEKFDGGTVLNTSKPCPDLCDDQKHN